MNERIVRGSFQQQVQWCEHLGSLFTARLLTALLDTLDLSNEVGRRVLGWTGDPTAMADGLALRLAGALQTLVLRGEASPALAALYPPNPLPSVAAMRPAVKDALVRHEADILATLRFAPQTNEAARTGMLFPGLVTVAWMTGARLALHEVGASAGLNLCMDRFGFRLGDRQFGAPDAEPLIAPEWEGAALIGPFPEIVSRRGCDINPLHIHDVGERTRLRSYIWPDQPARVARFDAAVRTALKTDFTLDAADAADWVEQHIAISNEDGVCPVLFHSIAFQYFPDTSKRRIEAHMERIGLGATASRPLAWLAFEQIGERGAHLVLRLWPGGVYRVLARSGAHVPKVSWSGVPFPEGRSLDAAMEGVPSGPAGDRELV